MTSVFLFGVCYFFVLRRATTRAPSLDTRETVWRLSATQVRMRHQTCPGNASKLNDGLLHRARFDSYMRTCVPRATYRQTWSLPVGQYRFQVTLIDINRSTSTMARAAARLPVRLEWWSQCAADRNTSVNDRLRRRPEAGNRCQSGWRFGGALCKPPHA